MQTYTYATHRRPVIRILLFLVLIAAAAFAGQPRMHEALNALRAAKTSAEPITELEIATQRLAVAAKNKGGFRKEAIPIIEQAIAAFRAGDRIGASKLIDKAINKVEKGIAAGVQ